MAMERPLEPRAGFGAVLVLGRLDPWPCADGLSLECSLAMLFSDALVLAQTASLVGIYGLSFLAVLIFSLPAIVADHRSFSGRFLGVFASLALLAGMAVFGWLRLDAVADPGMTDTDVRIVQPAIAQAEKWVPENRKWIFDTYLELSQKPLGGTARVGHDRLIVWPESAVPFLLAHEPDALLRISQALSPSSGLVTGAIRFEQTSEGPAYYNSVYAIEPDGSIGDVYDKVRLVPFGEFLPFRDLLQRLGLERLVDAPGDVPGRLPPPRHGAACGTVVPAACLLRGDFSWNCSHSQLPSRFLAECHQ